MGDIYNAQTVLLIGNDATQQNPLVAWQIRTTMRHHKASLYILTSQPTKLERKRATCRANRPPFPKAAKLPRIQQLSQGKRQVKTLAN